MNFSELSLDDFRNLALNNPKEFDKIPDEQLLRAANDEKIKWENTFSEGLINDSSIIIPEDFFEETCTFGGFHLDNGKLISIYLVYDGSKYVDVDKLYASHVLEQVFDEDDQLISEELKELI